MSSKNKTSYYVITNNTIICEEISNMKITRVGYEYLLNGKFTITNAYKVTGNFYVDNNNGNKGITIYEGNFKIKSGRRQLSYINFINDKHNAKNVYIDTSEVIKLSEIFYGSNFNQPLELNIINLMDMSYIFYGSVFDKKLKFKLVNT